MTAHLIAADWGTSSFRAYLVRRDGAVIDRIASADGILNVAAGGFADHLAKVTAAWRASFPGLPVILSGMIGSRQGWAEAAYVPCPASADAIAAKLHRVPAAEIGQAYIVPGVITEIQGRPDVMRGEETQVLGALVALGRSNARGHRLFVLPGTHAKWTVVEGDTIAGFSTFMTGEVFAALKDHTILGRLMAPGETDGSGFSAGVAAGAATGGPGALLNRIFATRTLGLTGRLPSQELSDYLSGVLIGAEFGENAKSGDRITIIGTAELAAHYQRAARLLGIQAEVAPADCVVGGHLLLAKAAGLLGGD